MSSFFKGADRRFYQTYPTNARGEGRLLNTYNFPDLTPRGRNEDEIMDWMQHHDRYDVPEPTLARH